MVFEKHQVKGANHQQNFGVFIASSCIVIGIYIPLLCFYLYKFYRMRNAAFLKHRFPILTIKAVISIVFVLFFGSFYGFLYLNSLDHIGLLILLLLMMFHGSVFCHCTMLRIWLLYFTVRVNKATANDVWQSIINPNKNLQDKPACDNPNAWFLQNRATYGNYQWCRKRLKNIVLLDIACALVFFIVMGICQRFGVAESFIHVIFILFVVISFVYMFFVPLGVIGMIYQHIPEFYDSLHLREELVFLSRLFVVCMPIFLVIVVALILDQFAVSNDRESEDSLWKLIMMSLDWQITALVLFFVARRMVYVYPNRLKAMHELPESSETKGTQRSVTMSEYKEIGNGVTATKTKRIKMRDVLKHEECFEVFIEHLAHEYCMESLLSIIEFTHFRDCILMNEAEVQQIYNANHQSMVSDTMGSTTTDSSIITSETTHAFNDKITAYYELPQGIVKSDIVFPGFYTGTSSLKCGTTVSVKFEEYLKNHKIEDKAERVKAYKQMVYDIYDKYIGIGSEYEINISYDVRMQYVSVMNNKDIWINEMEEFDEVKLCAVFDDCYNEMIRLMQHTFTRFKQSDKFDKVVEVLQ